MLPLSLVTKRWRRREIQDDCEGRLRSNAIEESRRRRRYNVGCHYIDEPYVIGKRWRLIQRTLFRDDSASWERVTKPSGSVYCYVESDYVTLTQEEVRVTKVLVTCHQK